jgi:hypothetical protein
MTHWAALKMARCQTDIARHLFAIVKRRAEHFANECGSKFWPGALELDQILFDVDRLRSAIKNVPLDHMAFICVADVALRRWRNDHAPAVPLVRGTRSRLQVLAAKRNGSMVAKDKRKKPPSLADRLRWLIPHAAAWRSSDYRCAAMQARCPPQ